VKPANLKAIGVLVAVFALGAVAGAGGAFAYTRDEIRDLADQPSMREAMRMRALSRRLALSDDQERELKAALNRRKKERREVWMRTMERCGEPIRQQKAELDAEIRKVLNDEQRTKFDRFVREHHPAGPPPE
jgi:uncharacterized membrane protein